MSKKSLVSVARFAHVLDINSHAEKAEENGDKDATKQGAVLACNGRLGRRRFERRCGMRRTMPYAAIIKRSAPGGYMAKLV